jgi:hypothetical protein
MSKYYQISAPGGTSQYLSLVRSKIVTVQIDAVSYVLQGNIQNLKKAYKLKES